MLGLLTYEHILGCVLSMVYIYEYIGIIVFFDSGSPPFLLKSLYTIRRISPPLICEPFLEMILKMEEMAF